MGGKGGKYKRKESNGPAKKKAISFNSDDDDMMNDEIDAFHKQRDVVPMRFTEDMEESDEDDEQSVFNIEVISGDDDIPKRDDIGERRRKHELRVLAGAGVTSVDNLKDATGNFSSDGVAEANVESDPDSDLEYYKQVEQQHAAKLAAKSNKYSRTPKVSSLPDDTVGGKRLITHQMEKNRGLTRPHKKRIKNPRKKYQSQHKKAEVRRKGQVREVRKPTGPYGGETTGINAGISRSIRFKS